MIARTRLQKAVVESAKSLSPLTENQERLAIKHSIPHIAKLNTKGEYTCLECGHTWSGTKHSKVKCPHCHTTLQVDTTRKRNYSLRDYFMVITKCNGYQVLRMFQIRATLRKGNPASYWIGEAFQRWITPHGENVVVGRKRHFLTTYIDTWDFSSDMEIRSEHVAHTLIPAYIISRKEIIPELKLRGFNGNLHDISPKSLFVNLLQNPKYETMLKAGQIPLLQHFCKADYDLYKRWPQIKIAIRNHYAIKDASLWLDLLSALEYCSKDIHNPKFICPSELQTAHDHWLKKKAEKQRRERERQERERYFTDLKQRELDEQAYHEAKCRFFDITITDGTITIRVLDSVKAFFDEGATHNHCVGRNEYFKKPNSLILSASISGKSVETIEIDLLSMEVVQCRGSHNQSSPYHDQILSLMRANIQEVAKRIA